jgi:glutathione S-transferase
VPEAKERDVSEAVLTINSRNYGAWSLRGWLLCRFAGINFSVETVETSDEAARSELLLLSPSLLVPRLRHGDVTVWGTMAIAEYLCEIAPERSLLPESTVDRALCRSISGEMHSGFSNLRSALPMNLKAHYADYPIWSGPQADLERIEAIWTERLGTSGGPFLFGEDYTIADAMFAPVCTRVVTYSVKLGAVASDYVETIVNLPEMREWAALAAEESDELEELDMEF